MWGPKIFNHYSMVYANIAKLRLRAAGKHHKTPSPVTGFTLIELIIAVSIVAILAAIAMPMYSQYYQRGKISLGLAELSNLAVEMAKAQLDYRTFVNGTSCRVNAPENKYFTFKCEGDANSYLWVASSKDGNYEYGIDQNQTRTTIKFSGSTVSTSNCWQVASNGECY